MDFLDGIYDDIDAKRGSGVLFLDLKKAFDTVSHPLLLNKSKAAGLKESAILWMRTYLCARFQITKCNSVYSE